MSLCVSRWIATLDGGSLAAVAAAVVFGYAAGFVVLLAWTSLLHRRARVPRPVRGALPAALMGGALGGLSVLLLATAEQFYGR